MAELLYATVYEALRSRIESGALPVGAKVPSQAELIAEFQVSAITVRRALDMLKNDGYVTRRPKIGTVVRSASPAQARPAQRPLVGCVLTNYDDTFGTHLLSGVIDAADRDADVIVKRTLGDTAREERMIQELVETGAAGILVLPSSSSFVPPAVLRLAGERYPLVILDRAFGSVPVSSVFSDNFAGAVSAVEFLFDLGHTNVGLMLPTAAVSTVEQRHNGYVHAHAVRHMSYDPDLEFHAVKSVVPGSQVPAGDDIAAIRGFLTERPHVTALLVSEYNIALLASRACAELGKQIPRDMSVVCFDHPPTVFSSDTFRFTHVQQNQELMGATALAQLLRQLTEPDAIAKHVLPTALITGASTAPPARRG